MPEYLAPAVYVEEIDTGNKPIEGVSTSTAGMVGVTERGPVNVPILITSYGEYVRWFGARLNRADFDDHCYLPYAAEGFFTNGGKRVYVTRILDTTLARRAAAMLFDRGTPPFGSTFLLRAARENTGTASNLPLLVVLDGTNLAQNDWIRIGDGSDAEYHQISAPLAAENVLIPLSFPLSRSHGAAGAVNVEQFTPGAPLASFTLAGNSQRGDQTVEVTGAQADITALAVDDLLEIGATANVAEHRFVRQVIPVSATHARVRVDSALIRSYNAAVPVRKLTLGAGPPAVQLDGVARAGETMIFVGNRGGDFDTRTDLIVIDRTNAAEREVRRIGELHVMTISPGMGEDYPASTLIEAVNLADGTGLVLTSAATAGATTILVSDVRTLRAGLTLQIGPAAGPMESVDIQSINPLTQAVTLTAVLATAKAAGDLVVPLSVTAASAAGTGTITVSDVVMLRAGQTLLVGPVGGLETVIIQSINIASRVVTLTTPLAANKAVGDLIIPVRRLTAAAAEGAIFVSLDNRMGLAEGEVLRIGAAPDDEYVRISALPNRAPVDVGPDAGNVILAAPLLRDHEISNTVVVRQNPATATALQPTFLAAPTIAGSDQLLLSDGNGYVPAAPPANSFIRLTTPAGVFFHRITALTAGVVPQMITLDAPLDVAHQEGSPIVERTPLLNVEALDAGVWGNRLRISVVDEPAGMASRTALSSIVDANHIRLASAAGVEAGTILEVFNPADNALVGDLLKVTDINRASNFTITLEGAGISAAQSAPGLALRSREFKLTVYLFRQPDPALPSRNETIIDSEVFRYLSMDPRHSRYVQTIVGNINGTPRLSDRRPEGESMYIRMGDQAPSLAAAQAIRLGPETLVDVLPDGRNRSARHQLRRGDDSVGTLTDAHYIGQGDPDPENRTGLHSLRNIEEISIIACPGRTSTQMQGALIDHCELMRYRFVALDGSRPPQDTLSDVQTQRQQFDTKYAALYHPWLLIPDPYPTNLSQIADYPIPPSGHILGVYARTDIERGVHKAPANEVVRGITGLQRILNKEQHDILNPYPVNINVIRDFRDNNRGIRVYGGRVITSDSDWKYVNVRRLLIFIEASIDRGLQWVVFEPNAEPLWARVRRSISNFLTLVWRNGGLEGTKVEEAYFVKCDRTTMTQTDIDSGRLIVLVGVAPVKPAEFVIVRIGLWTAHAED